MREAVRQRLHRPRFDVGTLRYSALGLALLIVWLLVGELGMAMRDRAVLPASLEILRRYGGSDHQVSLLLSGIPAVLSLLMSPLVGPASDRYRSRWGRRRPFLFMLAPLGGVSLVGVALSAEAGNALHALFGNAADQGQYALIAFGFSWTLFCAVMLCVQALYIGLVNDVLPRNWLGRFFGMYRIVSLGIGIAFYLWVFPLLDRHPHLIIGLIGALFTVMLMTMCVMVREGDYPAPPAALGSAVALRQRLRAGLADAFTLPGARWRYGALILGGMAFGPFNTFSQYYAESLGVSKGELGEISSLAYGISMALALVVGAMVDRLGAVRMSLIIMGLYTVSIAVGFGMLHDADSFRPVYLLHVVLSGTYFTAAASLPMALFPRLDFLRYCAFKDLIGSFIGIALSLAQGAVLDRSGHDYRLTLLFAALCGGLCALCLSRVAWKPDVADLPAVLAPPRSDPGHTRA